ncbi:MAG: acetyl-CoA C-acyltransferase [Myxococcales bacterium]|nr:acetyl-CoA C-acyltransferase [Myxococcales bacterium]
MSDVYFIDAIRTPIGRYGGGLAPVRADDLLADTIKALVEKTGIDPGQINDVFMGCSNQAGEDNRNIARMASLLAGLPNTVPGVTVNRLCGSGLEAVIQAARAIRCGEGDLFLAGGVENMTRAPYSLPKYRGAKPIGNAVAYDTALGWRYPNPRMEKSFPLEQMGETAENLAEKYAISREDQDAFALGSHTKAAQAIDSGDFENEIVPVQIPGRKGQITTISVDEGPRRDTSLEKLARLRAVFRQGGTVTAGNSSTLNDGACAVLMASEAGLKALGGQALGRFVSNGVAGVDPCIMGIGPVPASRLAMERAGLGFDQLGQIELNEAFAAQSLAVIRELDVDPSYVNPYGGAIALGHPLGCSGARVLTTLLHGLKRNGGGYGLATLCIGVGQGIATVVEV